MFHGHDRGDRILDHDGKHQTGKPFRHDPRDEAFHDDLRGGGGDDGLLHETDRRPASYDGRHGKSHVERDEPQTGEEPSTGQ